MLISSSAIAYNLFLPSIPDIADAFAVSIFQVQGTLIAFLIAYALAQFFYGGFSDRFGRRPTLLFGLAVYVVASLLCAVSTSITMLLAARILQGIGAAGSIVMVRSIVRDLFDRENAARALAIISTVMVFAPATAPAIGGFLHTRYGWQASFVFLAGLGAILFAYCALRMAETSEAGRASLFENLRALVGGYAVLVRNRAFVAYNLNIGFIGGAIFAWFAGVPVVLINSYGVAPDTFGLLMMLGTSGAFCGYGTAIWLTGRIGVNRMIVLGTAIGMLGASIYLALPLAGVFTPVAATAPIFVFNVGLSMTFPAVMAAAVSVRPHYAGTAAAMNGLMQYGMAAVTTLLVGALPHTTHLPLAWIIFTAQAGAVFASIVGWCSRSSE
ncbi:MAG: multidrug effflux MFS transporter [Alphaproteobacteria bacterium]|nr:multidrug effflux MFS transporter [Alphaproteobacteria bacterium]